MSIAAAIKSMPKHLNHVDAFAHLVIAATFPDDPDTDQFLRAIELRSGISPVLIDADYQYLTRVLRMTRSTDADERMAGQTLVSQFGLGCLFWQDPSGELWERAEDEGIWNPLTLEALDENIRAIASEFEMADLEEAVRRVRKILLRTATRPQSLRKTPVPTIMDIDRRPIDFLAALQANRAKA